MATFVLVTKLDNRMLGSSSERKAAGVHWLNWVKELCPNVSWISHYALLGRYDFMDIYDAPDAETAQKIAILSRSLGAREVESWQATPYESYLKILGEVNALVE